MQRFGASDPLPRQMDPIHLFRMQLHLLMVMIKAALKGYPVGEFRKRAVMDTAGRLHQAISEMSPDTFTTPLAFHLLRERVKLICVMAMAIISEEYPLGIHRREAVLENMDSLVEAVFPEKNLILFHDILKAA